MPPKERSSHSVTVLQEDDLCDYKSISKSLAVKLTNGLQPWRSEPDTETCKKQTHQNVFHTLSPAILECSENVITIVNLHDSIHYKGIEKK